MADLDTSSGGGSGKKSGPKAKKQSTRIDMTAMVDVAFLLLTFFVLTAVIADFSVMNLTMPPKAEDIPEEEKKAQVDEEKVVTLILSEKDTIIWFKGITEPEVFKTTYDPKKGLRKVILDHLRSRPDLPMCSELKKKDPNANTKSGCWDPIFVVKPRFNARYGNLVDALDELVICGADKYAVAKFEEKDSILVFTQLAKQATEEPK